MPNLLSSKELAKAIERGENDAGILRELQLRAPLGRRDMLALAPSLAKHAGNSPIEAEGRYPQGAHVLSLLGPHAFEVLEGAIFDEPNNASLLAGTLYALAAVLERQFPATSGFQLSREDLDAIERIVRANQTSEEPSVRAALAEVNDVLSGERRRNLLLDAFS